MISAPAPDIPILSAGVIQTLPLCQRVLAEYLAETGQIVISPEKMEA
jgi:hypothetical protein